MRITLRSLKGAPGYIVTGNGQSLTVQTDWDFPGIARIFGWNIRDVQFDGMDCAHESTDGTVTCRQCGQTPTNFIHVASNYLDDHIGTTAEDPGYFS